MLRSAGLNAPARGNRGPRVCAIREYLSVVLASDARAARLAADLGMLDGVDAGADGRRVWVTGHRPVSELVGILTACLESRTGAEDASDPVPNT